MNSIDLLTQAVWKGTLVLVAGFAAAFALRHASAALRHYLWTMMFGTLLALPLASTLGPKWTLPVTVTRSEAAAVTAEAAGGAGTHSTPARPLPWIWLYAAGAASVAIRFVAGAARTRGLLSGGVAVACPGVPRNVRVIESPSAPVPLVWGIARPVIVLPAAWRSWSPDRLRTVLLHELIHVERRDLLAQVIAQAACCCYWFHPLAWIAARELRRERERACDDAVLRRGVAAPEYAGHLVDLVRGLTVEAPAMAQASDFEARVRALLDRGRNRAPLTRPAALTVAVVAAALILPMASVTSHAQGARAALAGIVIDPSGARVPNVHIRAKNLDGANSETGTSDAAGEYAFRSIPSGRYELEYRAPGFKMKTLVVAVAGPGALAPPATLDIGEATESVTVSGARSTARPAALAAAPQRIPIGGNVQPIRLLRQVKPEYPEDLKQQGITGAVMIRAIVGTGGMLLNPQVLNADVHPGLAQAALNAVRQWQYEPTRLNGAPVETLTTITISFEAGQ